ncbi:zinc finger protein, putative [Plasmodium ovale wallikeri]|uniref:Zinc finger protein, putative n=2 Tax=Plasmodium ovale TaxID=36330 RepID=A0A1A9A1Y8_PLAOA|nr:zinc finger protein, putative [Plasmodium ovale wallikeri]SBT50443.1 zinc finger protein, putative [Plasmodium ovale wallikeri]SBT82751.1 zinc finger protein, putative [Plasmodium ovale]
MMNRKKSNPLKESRSNGPYKSNDKNKSTTDNYGRKVWDKDYYKQIAEEKNINEEDELILKLLPDLKKNKTVIPVDPSERKLLEERKEIISLEKNLGKVQIVTPKTVKEEQGGYYCKICDCVLKDSQTYLDHINGKNHNRMLGYSMKVKRVSVDEVKKKLNLLKDKKNNKIMEEMEKDPYEDAKRGLKNLQQMEEKRLQKRKEKRLLKKLEKQKRQEQQEDEMVEDTMMQQFKQLGLPTSFV